ncbi:unannotated protein [freshwater metagenome]|uniref:Unannotated protein n=1 Tax=freshwater metagenome TaxID=449393 RepID=A0A6J6T1D3_9ZZZZ
MLRRADSSETGPGDLPWCKAIRRGGQVGARPPGCRRRRPRAGAPPCGRALPRGRAGPRGLGALSPCVETRRRVRPSRGSPAPPAHASASGQLVGYTCPQHARPRDGHAARVAARAGRGDRHRLRGSLSEQSARLGRHRRRRDPPRCLPWIQRLFRRCISLVRGSAVRRRRHPDAQPAGGDRRAGTLPRDRTPSGGHARGRVASDRRAWRKRLASAPPRPGALARHVRARQRSRLRPRVAGMRHTRLPGHVPRGPEPAGSVSGAIDNQLLLQSHRPIRRAHGGRVQVAVLRRRHQPFSRQSVRLPRVRRGLGRDPPPRSRRALGEAQHRPPGRSPRSRVNRLG